MALASVSPRNSAKSATVKYKYFSNGKTIPRKTCAKCALNLTCSPAAITRHFNLFLFFRLQSIWHPTMLALHGIDKFHRVGYASSASSISCQMLFMCCVQCTVNQRRPVWHARIVRLLPFALRHCAGVADDRFNAAVNELPIFAVQFVTKWSN